MIEREKYETPDLEEIRIAMENAILENSENPEVEVPDTPGGGEE